MNIRPVPSKEAVQQPQSSAQTAAQSKARAVAAFNKGTQSAQPSAPQHASHPPQLDQNALGAEDLGSISIPAPNVTDKDTLDESASSEAIETTPTESQTETPAKDPTLSRQFAQLARQEKVLRAKAVQQEQSLKAREAALAAREAELTAKQPDLSKYITRDRLKQDPLSVLAEAEVSYDQLTQQLINRQAIDPQVLSTINDLKAQIQELKSFNEQGQKNTEQATQAQYQAAIKQIQLDAKSLVKSDPVTYEAIHKTGTVKEIVKLIEDTWNKDGVLLSVEEAANEVENYLVEENYQMATRIDKIKKRINQVAPSNPPAKTSPVASQQPQQMKTLTNTNSSSRPLSARERAVLAFKGQLK